MRNFIFISPHFPTHYWKFCLALKNKGWNVLGIGDAHYQDIPEECKYSLNEYYCCPNMNIYENIKVAFKYFENKYGLAEFLESNNEFYLINDAKLRTAFKIKSGANNNEVKRYRYKSEQKKYFKKARCPYAPYVLSNDLDEIIDFSKEVGFPLFAKPNDGIDSKGCKKINDLNELKKFVPTIKDKEYIFEQFIDGEELSFDGICNSKSEVVFLTKHFYLGDRTKLRAERPDDGYYCDPHIDDELKELGKRVVKAFDIKQRFFHIEFFKLNKDYEGLGKKGDYVALEANMRPAGRYITDLMNYANSLSCYDIYADVITNDDAQYNNGNKKYYAITSSRRDNIEYLHSKEEIISKYQYNLCMYGEYQKGLDDEIGDWYFIAKFDTLDEIYEFDRYVRGKKI